MDLELQKRELRRTINERRRAVGARERRAVAEAAAVLVLDSPEFDPAASVGIFAALSDEPSTRSLFDAIVRVGKPCLLPRCLATGVLEYARVERWGDLRPGRYRVLEPSPEIPATALGDGDLVVLPGVAFDASGGRLGRGLGYYDRTFPVGAAGAPILFGLAFACQLVDRVPRAAHDRGVDAVMGEFGLLRTSTSARVKSTLE